MIAPIAPGTYNPSQVPKETLLAEFTARLPMLADLLTIVRSNAAGEPCQHSLLIGPRGFGKTTFLYALKYRLEEDEKLAAEWTPLLFDEENYQIADLAGFWLECLRLAESAFRVSAEARYPTLSVSRDPQLESQARDAFLSLMKKQQRRALLLIDNINDILAVVCDASEQHRLRAFLMEESRVCVAGTASVYFDAIRNSDQPFYNLFRTFRLDRFTPAEMKTAVHAMAEARAGERTITLPESAGYWKGLHILTGGNPRLVKMVFHLMEQGVTPDFRAQLEGLLDAYTPYFKHRIEAMSPQQRRVFDAIALAWDPVQIGDIAPGLRMDSNKISAQVGTLMDAQLIAIAGGSTKRRTYQIADRFSNIYYFMRYSRGGRSRFEWFVLTMKAILTPEQFRSQIDRMREHGLACASAAELRDNAHLLARATYALDDPKDRRAEAHKSIAAFLTHPQEAALRHLLDDPEMRDTLAGEHAVICFFAGLPRGERESIGYQPDNSHWWNFLANLAQDRSFWLLAESAFREAIALDSSDFYSWYGLGYLLKNHLERYGEAEASFQEASKLDPSSPYPWNSLGNLLVDQFQRYEEGEAAYRKAIELDPTYAYPWNGLGNLLTFRLYRYDRYEEAEIAYQKAIELAPEYANPWHGMGELLAIRLHRFEEAEIAYRRAIQLDPSAVAPKASLADLIFQRTGRTSEAIALATDAVILELQTDWPRIVFRKVALVDPNSAVKVLRKLVEVLRETQESSMTNDRAPELYSLALDCVCLLLRTSRDDEALALVDQPPTRELFDIPIRAIEVRRDPAAREKLATERLALVDAFLENLTAPPAESDEIGASGPSKPTPRITPAERRRSKGAKQPRSAPPSTARRRVSRDRPRPRAPRGV